MSEKLWNWFGLSRATFLTLPRVLMHEMSEQWQDKMADLLKEYDDTFSNPPDIGSRVLITDSNGKTIKTPAWITNYRRPNQDEINKLKDIK